MVAKDLEFCQELVGQYKVLIDPKNVGGETPLHIACRNGLIPVCSHPFPSTMVPPLVSSNCVVLDFLLESSPPLLARSPLVFPSWEIQEDRLLPGPSVVPMTRGISVPHLFFLLLVQISDF